MKTKIAICSILISIIAVVTFFSCDNPIALGTKLDLLGPVVTIISPSQRQSVPAQFEINGTVYDDSGIDRMVIKAVSNGTSNKDFPRQWRNKGGAWEISDDYGKTWSPYAGAVSEWTVAEKISWKITIDMMFTGHIEEGEYTFNIQAWDKGNFTDDNSFKAIVLIVDLNPPKVIITNPYLYDNDAFDTDSTFLKLHGIPDESKEWQDTSYLGKFITQEFSLKWQIEDSNDVWSIDLIFYPYDTVIDNDYDTPLPDNYIYRYYKNTPPPPSMGANPNDYIKLNGSVTVPNLYGEPGIYNENGEILHDDTVIKEGNGELTKSILEKTTIKVVAVCYDVAGNTNQEKTLGYFISWPKANSPWIVFTEGIMPPDVFYDEQVDIIESSVFTVYPGRNVKATAFQAHGVKEVKYSLYKCDTSGNKLNRPETHPFTVVEIDGIKQENIVRSNIPYGDTYSNIFPWEIDVPPITGYYVFTAEAFSSQGISNEEYNVKYVKLFRVHDITFPDFDEGVEPSATDPLFLDIKDNKITIHGIVRDATNVVSLCLVWINPESKDFAAMSQLAYFRDKDYKGWHKALTLAPGTSDLENIGQAYDDDHRNRLWNVNLNKANPEIDYKKNRRRFSYSQEIDLTTDLNIAADKQPLRSQVFLLRAQNPDGKCTIITYAPQGDTLAPDIKITKMVIAGINKQFIPNEYAVIPRFVDGNEITISGTWREDSLQILPIEKYFSKNFEITINNQGMPYPVLTSNLQDKTTGTWTITATVKETPDGAGRIALSALKDTLVIGANVKDIGGNVAEAGCSWLIESDNLRLMRISSEEDDGIYMAGKEIDIFMEFSKPVSLTTPVIGKKPELILSSASGNAARAVYKDGQTNQNSRQYFTYKVGAGHGTGTGWLNVIGIYFDGKVYSPSDPTNTSGYPFSWSKGTPGVDGYEEVRITMAKNPNPIDPSYDSYDGNTKEGDYYLRTLPTTTITTNPDYQFTLTAGKHIEIDTAAPVIQSITSSDTGYHNSGDIYITAKFNKPVTITGVPRLTLVVTNGVSSTVQTNETGDVRINDKDVTFVYSIKDGDTTNGSSVVVSNFSGTITDLAGNQLTSFGGNRILTNVFIETLKPSAPTVRVLTMANVSNVISQNVSGDINQGLSTYDKRNLSNVYQDNLWLAIQGDGDPYKYSGGIEYSLDGGTNWVKAGNTANTPFSLSKTGSNTIVARQIDAAGNVTANTKYSPAITFNWDPGTLVSRISSTNANGTYTHVSGRNQIAFTVYFRNELYISSATIPQITLQNVRTYNNNLVNVTIPTISIPGGAVNSLTFTYTVGFDSASGTGDYMSGGTSLDIGAISGITAWDGNAVNNGVNVSGLITLPSGSPKLEATKQFSVLTGALTNTVPTFASDSGSESSADYHGIRSDDGSYWTTLQIPFNRAVTKNSGTITIQQIAGSGDTAYRLPAVLTEAQYNRFKSNAYTSGIVDTYYVKGTNGYINGTGSDTSNKYVLQYKWDPRSDVTANDTGFTGNTPIPSGVFTAFRNAEKIEIDVNASVVTIDSSSNTLKIRLSGSNAPQVPGASYEVTYPAGLVTDTLGNNSTVGNYIGASAISLRGVAKPFVRIKKTQDTISVNASPSMSQPRLVATQPFLANVRMDCRTPNSAITYNASTGQTNVTGNLPGTAGTNNNWDYQTGPTDVSTPEATHPGSATGSDYTNSSQLTIGYDKNNGNTPTINNVQGFQWWVRARAGVGTTYSNETEEMAYRTVISYSIRNANGDVAAQAGRSRFEAGDQAWIRGGDSIGTSSIPGFPFTWEDDWNNLKNKRAGIRLMTMITGVDNNVTWYRATRGNNNLYTADQNGINFNNYLNASPGFLNIEVDDNGTISNYSINVTSRGNRTFNVYNAGTTSTTGATARDIGTPINFRVTTAPLNPPAGPTVALNNSLWRFVTWEMNTTAYVDFIRGRDLDESPFTASDADVAWQYGPKRWCYQVDGWTAFKDMYPIYAGKHRWCDMGYMYSPPHGTMNFSGTFMGRPDKAVDYTGVNQP